jgi:hypothetical protein
MPSYLPESTHGEREIMRARFHARSEENLPEDMISWEVLTEYPLWDDYGAIPKTIDLITGRRVNDPEYVKHKKRGNKLVATLCRLLGGGQYPGYENIVYNDTSSVKPWQLSQYAKELLHGGPLATHIHQLMVCREPNRQSSDEIMQYGIRKTFLPDCEVENLVPGHLTLMDGEFVVNDAALVASSETTKSRSIDFRITKGSKVFYDAAKFALVTGGIQLRQVQESKYFLSEFRKYVDMHPEEQTYFIDTLDGAYAEKHIKHHQDLVVGYEDRIFVGNSNSVIEWINSK